MIPALLMGRVFTSNQRTSAEYFSGPLHTRRCGATLSKQERAGEHRREDTKIFSDSPKNAYENL